MNNVYIGNNFHLLNRNKARLKDEQNKIVQKLHCNDYLYNHNCNDNMTQSQLTKKEKDKLAKSKIEEIRSKLMKLKNGDDILNSTFCRKKIAINNFTQNEAGKMNMQDIQSELKNIPFQKKEQPLKYNSQIVKKPFKDAKKEIDYIIQQPSKQHRQSITNDLEENRNFDVEKNLRDVLKIRVEKNLRDALKIGKLHRELDIEGADCIRTQFARRNNNATQK